MGRLQFGTRPLGRPKQGKASGRRAACTTKIPPGEVGIKLLDGGSIIRSSVVSFLCELVHALEPRHPTAAGPVTHSRSLVPFRLGLG